MKSMFKYLSLETKMGMLGVFIGIVLIINLAVGWYWSQEPKTFNVKTAAELRVVALNLQMQPGVTTTSTVLSLGDALLHKPGGYLSNDVMPPSIFLDNIVSWEFGVLVQLRDFTEAMREDLSRSQSQSAENKYLAKAEPKLKFDNSSWMLPPTESEYEDGLKQVEKYLISLASSEENRSNKERKQTQAQFYARADNLRNWLDHTSKRLGSISQRLSASVGQDVIDFDNKNSVTAQELPPTPDGDPEQNATPWLEIDNVFYEARGSTWAMLHLMKAVAIDFEDVLEKKAASASLKQIIRELESSQETLWSPMVLNGKGMGVLANHSLVMANYVSRANAAIIDLKTLLQQG